MKFLFIGSKTTYRKYEKQIATIVKKIFEK
nr:MAG TPA: hypothetical protein [Caudoviricetes sp.]DAX38571.1 MAG TPA: hypothetical protein [Caudoviricetes sp.]